MPSPGESQRSRLIDSIAELLQMASDWVRQEADSTVQNKIVRPLQRLGLTIASATASGCLLVMGLLFIAIALFLWVGDLIGYPLMLFIIGVVYMTGSAVFLVVKVRSFQK